MIKNNLHLRPRELTDMLLTKRIHWLKRVSKKPSTYHYTDPGSITFQENKVIYILGEPNLGILFVSILPTGKPLDGIAPD